MNQPFFIIEPTAPRVPVILSSPHSGTEFPDELQPQFRAEFAARPDDTDWFIHELYNFAPSLGITLVHARYSRWVIDLNRDPASRPLYNDGRLITELCPKTDFLGNEIYVDERFKPDEAEIARRTVEYYEPYHAKLGDLLDERRREFGVACLWDAHSIRRVVPTIQKDPFPDLILGDNDGRSSSSAISNAAANALSSGKFGLSRNFPFKGGHITRSFGDPGNGIHALQLEMSKTNYMNDAEDEFDETRANEVRAVLRMALTAVIGVLGVGGSDAM